MVQAEGSERGVGSAEAVCRGLLVEAVWVARAWLELDVRAWLKQGERAVDCEEGLGGVS